MREIFNEHFCMLDTCNQEPIDGMPPCAECPHLISAEALAEEQPPAGA